MVDSTLGLSSGSICAAAPAGSYVRSSRSCSSYNHCINGQVSCLKSIIVDHSSLLLSNKILILALFMFKNMNNAKNLNETIYGNNAFLIWKCLQAIHGECPKGFAFSAWSQTCDNNFDVNCIACSPFGIFNILNSTTSSSWPSLSPFSGIQHISNPNNCQMYYRCINGVRTNMMCSDGLLFDRYFGDCNLASKVQCETRNTICDQFAHLGLIMTTIGNPVDCTRFVQMWMIVRNL